MASHRQSDALGVLLDDLVAGFVVKAGIGTSSRTISCIALLGKEETENRISKQHCKVLVGNEALQKNIKRTCIA